MSREHDDAAPLGERLLHTLKMVDLDVFTEILLVQHRHGENVEDVARHIDKGCAHESFCRRLVNAERGHHVLHGTVPHLWNQQIVEIAEHPPRTEQEGTRRAARKGT